MPMRAVNNGDVGRRLETIRAATGLDRKSFAATIGVDPSSYTKIAKGEKPLNIDMGVSVAATWGVSLDFIYLGRLDRLPSGMAAKLAL